MAGQWALTNLVRHSDSGWATGGLLVTWVQYEIWEYWLLPIDSWIEILHCGTLQLNLVS